MTTENTNPQTPRTDELAKMYAQGVDSHYDGQRFCNLARTLELELQAAQKEIEGLKEELRAAKSEPPRSFLSSSDSVTTSCGHNSYWKTHYGNCMACRVEEAQKERDRLQRELSEVKSIQEFALNKDYYEKYSKLVAENEVLSTPPSDALKPWVEFVKARYDKMTEQANTFLKMTGPGERPYTVEFESEWDKARELLKSIGKRYDNQG